MEGLENTHTQIHFINPTVVYRRASLKHVRRHTLHNATSAQKTLNNNIYIVRQQQS
jgi:hypothetical protein